MPKIIEATVYKVTSAKLHPVILELKTDDGNVGIGEAAVTFGIGGRATAEMMVELCEALVLGKDADDIEALWSEMYDKSVWARGGGSIVFGAISAVDIALWDLMGKRLGLPVYSLLGGSVRQEASVYANGWNYEHLEPDGWARAAERPLKDGYDAIKCYPLSIPAPGTKTLKHAERREIGPELLRLARDRVKALRDVVGPEIVIRLDLCCAAGPDDVLKLCSMVESYDIDWLEEPAEPLDVEAHRYISERTSIPLATGERMYSRYGHRNIIESGAVSIIQPDVGTSGGISELKKIAAMADCHSMKFAPHNCASGISTSASMHLAVSTRNFSTLEAFPYFRELPGYVEVLKDNPEADIKGGRLSVSSAPGLGVELDHRTLEGFIYGSCKL